MNRGRYLIHNRFQFRGQLPLDEKIRGKEKKGDCEEGEKRRS